MLVPAPGLLSTTNCWPRTSESLAESSRALMSTPARGGQRTLAQGGTANLAGRRDEPGPLAQTGRADGAGEAAVHVFIGEAPSGIEHRARRARRHRIAIGDPGLGELARARAKRAGLVERRGERHDARPQLSQLLALAVALLPAELGRERTNAPRQDVAPRRCLERGEPAFALLLEELDREHARHGRGMAEADSRPGDRLGER